MPGCPELADGARCASHTAEQQREERARYPRQRYGAAWPKIRARQLREHPECQCVDRACQCGGTCSAPANEVDHRTPARFFTTLRAAHDPSNLQSLCKPCHSSKTAREDSTFSRR